MSITIPRLLAAIPEEDLIAACPLAVYLPERAKAEGTLVWLDDYGVFRVNKYVAHYSPDADPWELDLDHLPTRLWATVVLMMVHGEKLEGDWPPDARQLHEALDAALPADGPGMP